MAALGPKADIVTTQRDVRFIPKSGPGPEHPIMVQPVTLWLARRGQRLLSWLKDTAGPNAFCGYAPLQLRAAQR